jgi:putative CocE/NonD family hydrolase
MSATSPSNASEKPQPYVVGGAALERDVMISMRDGVRLATDIYRPAADGRLLPGPFPVILERTTYGKNEPSRSERTPGSELPMPRAEVANYFVRHGYVVVYQDCRGCHDSEGRFTKYLDEANDGYDTCAWIVDQPWCNGSIATKGLSYAAHTQVALGCLRAPGVKGMFVDSGGFSSGYRSGIRQGGAYELKQAAWACQFATTNAQRDLPVALLAIDLEEWFGRLPWRRGTSPLSAVPEYEDFLFDQWERERFDEYWRQPGIYAQGFYDELSQIPAIHMSSWYDPYALTAVENFCALAQRKGAPVQLIMGPWTHGDRWESFAGDVEFGPAAVLDGNLAPDFLTLRRRWFDRCLKGVEAEVEEPSPVRLFVMGGGSGRKNSAGRLEHGGRWRSERDWPIPGTQFWRYYLHPSGLLSPRRPGPGVEPLCYRFDPRNPVPTIGGSVVSRPPRILGGAFDQREDERFFGCCAPGRPLAQRADVLVFQTDPLSDDVEITGPVVADFWISSDCVDTDFTVKLIDVYPPSPDYPEGFAMNLTDGIMRARYWSSWEKPRCLVPGEVARIRVEAFPTSNLFQRGHRIRIDVSSSNFPKFDVNPNTGEPVTRATESRVANNSLYVDAGRPSHVILPIIPARR